MTTLSDVRMALPAGVYTCSVDLADAYWHVPVNPRFQPFLGFKLGSQRFQFQVMPFGLNIAPRIFTKITKPIVEELRSRGVFVVVYLDDWLVWAPSKYLCNLHTNILLEVLQRRGFKVNHSKSRLVPSQSFKWLGVHWDTRSSRVSLPEEKVISLSRDLSRFFNRISISRRDLERVLGKLQFAALVDPIGKALLKSVNLFLRSFANQRWRDRKVPFPQALRTSLRRWLRPGVLTQSVPFRPPPVSFTIFTDASRQGWGAHSSGGDSLRGRWSLKFAKFHINILELIAVFLALRKFRIPVGSHVAVHCDNTTAVNCINRGGSARSPPLNSWILSILTLLKKKGLFISAFHIAGVRNVIADSLSRSAPVSTEWELDQDSFDKIVTRWGAPQVDLFATAENFKVNAYISPVPDPQSLGTDAFAQDWSKWNKVYLFPPTAMLPKIIPLLDAFRGTAIVVTPAWKTRTWFVALESRARDKLLLPCPHLSQRVGGEVFSNLSKIWNPLVCWKL